MAFYTTQLHYSGMSATTSHVDEAKRARLLNKTATDVDVLTPALGKSTTGMLLIENIIVVAEEQLLHSRQTCMRQH